MQPTPLTERIYAIDLMRGFSLLGILLVNMLSFHTPYSYIDPYSWFSDAGDREVFWFIDVFVQASFYPLFAMLFGYGLAMQFNKSKAKLEPFMPIAMRRLLVLLGFGIIHAFLIWYGDILITYALMGFLLLGLIRLHPGWLLGIGVLLYTLPHMLLLGLMFLAVAVDPNFYTGIQEVSSSIEAYATGSFAEVFAQRLNDWTYANNFGTFFVLVFTILPFLLVGAAAAKWRLIERVQELKKLWIVLAIVPFLIGFVLKLVPFVTSANYATIYVQDMFGGPLLAVSYAAIIALIARTAMAKKVLSPVAKAGRMSMTTYLTQSVVATLIFYSYGLGLYGQVDILTGSIIALGIFAVQLIFSEFWLQKFRQGPVEMLWRKLTYGKNRKPNQERA